MRYTVYETTHWGPGASDSSGERQSRIKTTSLLVYCDSLRLDTCIVVALKDRRMLQGTHEDDNTFPSW